MSLIETVRPKSSEPIDHFGEKVTPQDMLISRIGNPAEKGWFFASGDPEFWKFKDKLVVPGGTLLDLGIGYARSSLFFALHGMPVVGYDNDPNVLKFMRALVEGYSLPITVVNEDIRIADFGSEQYDTVMLGQTFVHFASKEEAFDVIRKSVDALKRGGYLWFRAAGKEDSSFEDLYWYANQYPEITQVDDDVYMAPCECSGEYKIEPQLFFDPVEILGVMAQLGLKTVHTQVIPQKGQANIMFGEDWQPERPHIRDGIITVLSQKI